MTRLGINVNPSFDSGRSFTLARLMQWSRTSATFARDSVNGSYLDTELLPPLTSCRTRLSRSEPTADLSTSLV